ncbi:DUF1080 domain-containing protein [bacterium]|nr:DUF1080 domain-containing protein [bacterium]
MKKAWLGRLVLSALMTGAFALGVQAQEKTTVGDDLTGFVPLFDGKTLDGWRKLTEYSGDKGKWTVEDGAITGDQYPAGEGGLLVTEKTYSNYEIYTEVKAHWPLDSGLFLRVQGNVLSYQVTLDYRNEGEIGAIYIPGGGDFGMHNCLGMSYWNPYDYNKLRVRIENQPPHIQVWLNGHQITDYQHGKPLDGKTVVPESGYIGVQVHPGENWGPESKVQFRKMLIKEL